MSSSVEDLRARRVLARMRERTPEGAPKPWRTAKNLEQIGIWLEEGASEDDLLDLVDGAADLVLSGRKSAVWWTVGSLFGDRSLDRWRAEIAVHREERRKLEAAARAREAELARQAPVAEVVGLDAGEVSPELRRHVERWRKHVQCQPEAQLTLFED